MGRFFLGKIFCVVKKLIHHACKYIEGAGRNPDPGRIRDCCREEAGRRRVDKAYDDDIIFSFIFLKNKILNLFITSFPLFLRIMWAFKFFFLIVRKQISFFSQEINLHTTKGEGEGIWRVERTTITKKEIQQTFTSRESHSTTPSSLRIQMS